MKESILKEKAMDFAIRIVNLYHFLNDKKQEKVMAKQILRSGTSIGANISEGIYAESTAAFINMPLPKKSVQKPYIGLNY